MRLWFKRTFYLDKICAYLDNTDLVKVLIGQRRVWKSYIMKQIVDYLLTEKKIQPQNILFINLEIDFLKYKDLQELDSTIKGHIEKSNKSSRFYLFIDEVQELNGWEKLINSYRANDLFDIDLFITWSNATLLSSDLSTYLAGRYIEFEIMPFSYNEYLGYFQFKNTKEHFLEYINLSWIPELYKMDQEESKINYLKSLKDSIILKDIVKRYNIKEIDLLERIFLFLSGNIGNLFSLNSIVKKLKWLNLVSNVTTIGNYINYLEKTFIIHGVERYDVKGKKILEWEKKYYLNDVGFLNFFVSSYDLWSGKKLENLVYNHLRHHGYKVYVGNIWNLEIDFVAEKGKEILYLQVAYSISSEEVFAREFWNLAKIKDNYKKMVLSLDEIVNDYEWIIHQNIWVFLTKDI